METGQAVSVHQFENGLTLIGKPMPWLQSAAFSFSVPAGCIYDPSEQQGLANFTCEMVQRGCGDLDSRQFIESLEQLGVNYNSSASLYHTHFGGAMPAARLNDTLDIYADVLRNPIFPDSQLEDGRMVCFQEIQAIEDDLAQQAMSELRNRHYGDPLGRSCEGTMESVQSISMNEIKDFFHQRYQPSGLILAVAGNVDWEQTKDHVAKRFGDWNPTETSNYKVDEPSHGNHHIDYDSNQTHITLAWESPRFNHPDYYRARCAIGVLSDGMSSRLFREVREKRGLCYTVFASCHSLRDRGSVVAYCGTSSERAQESLDVMVAEIQRLRDGITTEELDKLKVQIRSSLIMAQESSRARAGSIAGDYFHLGRIRTLDEINSIFADITVEEINQYLADQPTIQFDMVTLGKAPLELNDAVPSTST